MSFRRAGNASEPKSKAERGAFFLISATTWIREFTSGGKV
jgi:hypothetical protein